MEKIQVISLGLPFRMGTVNCFLVETDSGFILIDTGASNQRDRLEHALADAGCEPGNLRLVLLTHGDFDHIGNAAFLRDRFSAPIAMHKDDAGMAENGDMFWNRSSGSAIFRLLAPALFRFRKASRFAADFHIGDGVDLSGHGLDAQVLSLPGHSSGSIGILTAGGDLFCGDLLENTSGPSVNSIMDDPIAAEASIEKLQGYGSRTVYPGHGEPFATQEFMLC